MESSNGGEAAASNMNPLLLESARVGSWEALGFLFQREDAQEPPLMIPTNEFRALLATACTRFQVVPAAPDAELGVDDQPASLAAPQLLQGVTADGDTALHVVARGGDDEDFFKCANMICARDRGLPYAKNHIGDTPMRCAVRAGKSEMVSHLIDLTGRESAPRYIIHPLLLLSARQGSLEALRTLFDWQEAQNLPMVIPTEKRLRCQRGIEGSASHDEEEGVDHQPAPLAARELLKGVTHNGDTALHAAVSNGDGEDFLEYARMICGMDWDLLFAKNHKGDTPLHCAARAGSSKMVSHLMALALAGPGGDGPDGKLTLLRTQNKRHETVLHEAIRFQYGGMLDRKALFQDGRLSEIKIRDFVDQQGMTIVKQLMRADSQLANYPADGISPLYLAILLEKGTIAVTIYHESGGNLSYSGADGQNALHAAVHRAREKVMIEFLLHCNQSLTTQVDKDGSTPLHFVKFSSRSTWTLEKVFEANPVAAYHADKDGYFPIHVAAYVGATDAVQFFISECPDSAGLANANGKTFLHVAIEKKRLAIVSYACRDQSLAWILNMQDNDGNTALHLAVQSGMLRMVCALLANREVSLNVTNNQGETPRDLARNKLPRGLNYAGNSENRINYALTFVCANHGAFRRDKIEEKHIRRPRRENWTPTLERVKDGAQTFIIAAVLITTMAFTAAFAIPGGYRADDHPHGGTPTLAGRYIFDAFMMATTLAFICSSVATIGFMFAGNPIFSLKTRVFYFAGSMPFMVSSVTCLCIAFALAMCMVLAPVARNTAIVVCVISCPVSICIYMDSFLIMAIMARPLVIRKGLKQGIAILVNQCASLIVFILWPYIVIFGWAAFARIHHQR